MASSEGNVATLEVDGNTHDNVETTVTSTTAAPATTTTTTAVPETTTATTIAENIPPPSSSIEPAVESETTKEKKDTEELSTSQAATATATATASAAESTVEDIPAAIVIATPSTATQPTSTSTDVPKSEGPETVNIAEEGESSDQTQPAKETAEEVGPELVITLLLTTGARHPFKIDRKYLKRRSVKVENDDPFNMSVYTLKELIWREWRSEWEPQPSSPSSIRLISFGKLLDDKAPLSESSLTHDAPNVIHMTVKPQEVVDEEDAKGGKSYSARDREATDRSPGCRCVIL
jgi:hypothetical protein